MRGRVSGKLDKGPWLFHQEKGCGVKQRTWGAALPSTPSKVNQVGLRMGAQGSAFTPSLVLEDADLLHPLAHKQVIKPLTPSAGKLEKKKKAAPQKKPEDFRKYPMRGAGCGVPQLLWVQVLLVCPMPEPLRSLRNPKRSPRALAHSL